jgi:hypothetical protein
MSADDPCACPTCRAELRERDLKMEAVTRYGCPRCGSLVFEHKRLDWTDRDPMNLQDIAAIEAWLAAVADSEGVTVRRIEPATAPAEHRWGISGHRWPGECVVLYYDTYPGTLKLVLHTTEAAGPVFAARAELDNLCALRGVQSWADRTTETGMPEDHPWPPKPEDFEALFESGALPPLPDCATPRVAERWGACQVLAIGRLSREHFIGVGVRLAGAVKEVLAKTVGSPTA